MRGEMRLVRGVGAQACPCTSSLVVVVASSPPLMSLAVFEMLRGEFGVSEIGVQAGRSVRLGDLVS